MKGTDINPIFIGHGSPMNAISSNAYTQFLSSYALPILRPTAIVVISAHWQTHGTHITGSARPPQIYDFYGFPDELYSLQYSPIGSPDIARRLESENNGIRVDKSRGIDHAGWAVVKHLYPGQDIPLLELSLNVDLSTAEHFALGKSLSKYREDGILFIGSGNIVHNLRDISFVEGVPPFQWAVEADAWIQEQIEKRNFDNCIDYKNQMPWWQRAIPTDEHFLPLLYILGMAEDRGKTRTIFDDIQNGSISMRCLEVF